MGDQTIEVGKWNRTTLTFTPLNPADTRYGNAVRVRATRNNAGLFFGAVTGSLTTDIHRSAVAFVGPSCGGIWGLDGINVPGNVRTDSYDSRTGPYMPGTAEANGDVCSNQDIDIIGSITIDGDVFGNPVATRGDAYTVTGDVDRLSDPVDRPVIDFTAAAMSNDNHTIGPTDNGNDPFAGGWNLRLVGGDNLTVLPGTYYFDTITLRAGSTLTVTGPTTVYVVGGMDMTGSGIVNASQDPRDLTIYIGGANAIFGGAVEFYGSIIAPNTEVKFHGTSDVYGAIIAGSITMVGTIAFHVDESVDAVHMLKRAPIIVQ